MTLFDPKHPIHRLLADQKKIQDIVDKNIPRVTVDKTPELRAIEPTEYRPQGIKHRMLQLRAFCVKWAPLMVIGTVIGGLVNVAIWLRDVGAVHWVLGLAGR